MTHYSDILYFYVCSYYQEITEWKLSYSEYMTLVLYLVADITLSEN
jgi:hypothetical protein